MAICETRRNGESQQPGHLSMTEANAVMAKAGESLGYRLQLAAMSAMAAKANGETSYESAHQS